MAEKKTPKKTSKAAQREQTLEKYGLPKGQKLTDEFMTASLVVTKAAKLAISKAYRNEPGVLNKLKKGRYAGNGDERIRLTPLEVKKIEQAALKQMNYCIRHYAQHEKEPVRVTEDAQKIFNDMGSEKQMDKIRRIMPNVLSSVCVMPRVPSAE